MQTQDKLATTLKTLTVAFAGLTMLSACDPVEYEAACEGLACADTDGQEPPPPDTEVDPLLDVTANDPCAGRGGTSYISPINTEYVCHNNWDWQRDYRWYSCANGGHPVKVQVSFKKAVPASQTACPPPPTPDPATCDTDTDCATGETCAWAPGEALAFTCKACEGGECGPLEASALAFGYATHNFESAAACQAAINEGLAPEILNAAHASLLAEAESEHVCDGAVSMIRALDDGGAYWPTCGSAEGATGPTLSLDLIGYAVCG